MSIEQRYAEWCKLLWANEVENEFATLRLIDGSEAWCLVEAMDALPSRESRIAMGNALIGRRILNVPSPDADAFRSSVPLVSGRERRLDAAKSQGLWRPADRRRLWRAIQKHAVADVLGTPWTGAPVTERGGLYSAKRGRVEVQTLIDVGGSTRQLSYDQTILVDGEKVIEQSSFVAWFGYVPATHWHFIAAGEEEAATDLLLRLAEIGIRELPHLV